MIHKVKQRVKPKEAKTYSNQPSLLLADDQRTPGSESERINTRVSKFLSFWLVIKRKIYRIYCARQTFVLPRKIDSTKRRTPRKGGLTITRLKYPTFFQLSNKLYSPRELHTQSVPTQPKRSLRSSSLTPVALRVKVSLI